MYNTYCTIKDYKTRKGHDRNRHIDDPYIGVRRQRALK